MKTSKKILSVLLAVIMIMSTMSVCFGTIGFAAGGTATETQWNTLIAALKKDTVKSATFSGEKWSYTIDDPDGSIIAAVEAYWSVFETMANKSPEVGGENKGSQEANRTINQVNDSIKGTLSTRMGTDYTTYNVANFITGLVSGVTTSDITTGTGSEYDQTNSNRPATNLSAVKDVTLTVNLGSAILGYNSLDELPAEVVTTKVFTVSHTNQNYDYRTQNVSSGCSSTRHYYWKYFYNISANTATDGAKQSTKVLKDNQAVLDSYAEYFNAEISALVNAGLADDSLLGSVKTAVNNAKSNVVNFSAAAWNKFFTAYDVDGLNSKLDLAAEIISVGKVAEKITNLVAAGYAGKDKTALEALYSELTTGLSTYDASSQAAKEYIVNAGFDHAAVVAFANAVKREIELIELRALKATIDATVPAYYDYNNDNVTSGAITGATLSLAKGTVDGYIGSIGTYAAANVNEVMPGYTAELGRLSAELGRLITVAGYTADFSAEYAKYVSEVYGNTNLADDSEDLLAAVQNYDTWYSDLKNLVSRIETETGAEVAEKIIKDLDTEMKAHMDSRYNALYVRVDTQIDIAKELYDLMVSYNGKIDIINIDTYSKYERAFDVIERDVYDFLVASANFTMPQETIDKYNSLGEVLQAYYDFVATGGFNSFVQSFLEYENREVLENDVVKYEEYLVTKEKIENVVNGLDTIITSDAISGLLGGMLNEDGSALDIGAMLKGLISDALFTDSFINTVVKMLYPLVLTEFIKVWANDLPSTVNIIGEMTVYYDKDLSTILGETGFEIFPALLASQLDANKYAENITMLNSALSSFRTTYGAGNSDFYTTVYNEDDDKNVADKTPWDAPVLYKDGDPEGELALTWGVDAAKEAGKSDEEVAEIFYQAFDDAVEGLKPLLLALLANKSWTGTRVSNIAHVNFIGQVNVSLDLAATGNSGYANLLVPIYEALGVQYDSVTTVEGTYANSANEAADILRAILSPIFGLLEKLGEKPVETIISILPNLCYALSMQMVPSLLGMLKTDITYAANASIGCDIEAASGAANINVGEMLDLADMGVDLSDGLNSLLKTFGLNIPAIDQGLVATLGTLGTIDTQRKEATYNRDAIGTAKAYTIEADKAAVGYYLLTYIFGLLKDQEAFEGLLSMLVTKDVPQLDENGEAVLDENGEAVTEKVADEEAIAEVLATLDEIGLLGIDVGNAIGAVVELFNQEENNNFAEYEWYEGAIYDGSTVTNLSPAMIEYLSYDNDLTREKAAYIVDHLDELIGSILDMVNGNPEGTFSIAAELDKLIGGLFTNANITALAKTLGGLDLNALVAGDEEAEDAEDAEIETVEEGEASEGEAEAAPAIDITALLKDALGIDLGAYAQYADIEEDAVIDWGFTDGDAEGFVEALTALLEPLAPVLNFILAGEDIDVLGATTLLGYSGYDTALVPILEALGCEAPALKEGDNVIEVVLKAIVSKLDTIIGEGADAVEGIANILPGVLYFIQSNGLSTAVRNLLQPIYVILDTIRPIYDVDLNEIIGGLTADLGFTINLDDIGFGLIFDLVTNLVGLDLSELQTLIADVCKVISVEYTSSSSLIGENGKKGAYGESFDATDIVAVILNFAFDWCAVEANVDALAAVIGGDNTETVEKTKKYIAGIYALIEGIEPEYGTIDWAYNFPGGFDEAVFESGISIQPTIESLNYPTNWTEDTAKYIDENLDELIAAVLNLAGVEGTLSDMLKENINFCTGENLNTLVKLITDLLDSLNSEIVNSAGVLIGADLETLRNYKVDETKTYTTVEFAQELAKILGVIPEVINLVFFGDDFEIFNYANGETVGTVKGALGYANGLAPILEALGCKELPAADSKDVEGILVSIAKRFDEIIADPVNEIFEVLPNIIHFLNANGLSVSLKNILSSVTGFMAQLKESFDVDVDLIKIINDAINGLLPEDADVVIDANNLDLETVFALVQELLGLDLSAASDILVDFCVGKLEPYRSISGEYGFRMVYDDAFARYDMITIIATVALMLVENEQNAKALDELIGTEIISALKTVFESAPVVYATPDWDYCWAEDGIDYENGTVEVMEYAITYPNNWTIESAQYVAENLGPIGDMIAGLIDSNYTSLSALVNDKVKIYSSENIQSIVDAIAGLLGNIDATLIETAGVLLGADLNGLASYEAPAGIDTAEEFAAELTNVLTTYAGSVLEWLLLGKDYRFFVDETVVGEKYEIGEEIITINGGHGYAEGLALVLEALGCENLPEAYDTDATTKEIVEGALTSLFARVDEILANPVVEIVELLPNLLYFLNANGVAIAIDNLLAAVNTLLNKLTALGVELDINSLINIEELLGIEKDLSISLDNLTIAAILELASELTGLDLTVLEELLVGFALGEVAVYESVSRNNTTYKMYYHDEFAMYDMITVIATAVMLTVKDEDNAEEVEELVGEDVYNVILNVFNMGEVPVQEFDWKFTDKADTGYTFSAINTSELYANHKYGPLYTEEMAQYISDNIGEFIDNIIYLVGISINGSSVDNLKELINEAVNGSLYNSENVVAIRDGLAGVLEGIGSMEGGEHIKAILKSSLKVDLEAVAKVNVPDFKEDRAKFVTYLCDVLEPLYPVLKWILGNEDFTFFVNEEKNDLITLKGAEGYAYGIIPLLEVLECENILSTEEYYAAVEADSDVVLTSILNPLLDRVDVITEDPAEAILSMLPNLIYFINSNGIDTVVKNTLNAVYTLLNAIEPIAKIDLYELIGLDLSTLTFEKLFDMLLNMIADSTGYKFSALDASAIAELTIGTLESYTSKNGKTAYKMVYQSEGAEAEMVTVVMRLIVTFIMHENNQEALLGLLRDYLGMSADAEKYVRGVLDTIATCATETYLGMDKALATIYYLFYGVDIAVGETTDGLKDVNAQWQQILKDLGKSDDPNEKTIGNLLAQFLDEYMEDVFTSEGVAPNGFIAFFQKIIEWFQKIIEWFKNLFN